MVCKILLVGAGFTSAITVSLLRKLCQKHVYLVVWDKETGVGGRMNTISSPFDPNCIVDLGAKYIASSQDNFSKYSEIYESLLCEKLLEPLCSKIEGIQDLSPGTKQFVAPNGMDSLVKHFLNDAADEIHVEHHVVSIYEQGNSWIVETMSGVKDVFDIVILTIPVPLVLELKGSIQEIISENHEMKFNLKSVEFDSRYTLCLFFNSNFNFDIEWGSKYIYDNDIFRYVSFDNKKRNRPGLPPAVVFHTSVQYGANNVARDMNDVKNELANCVKEMFPNWPEPEHTECLRWQYSQVTAPYSGQPGCLMIAEHPLIVAGGDSFTSSHVDGCISSALILADTVSCAVKSFE